MNPYEGIEFVSSQNMFAATIPNGRHTNVVGYYHTLEEATRARREALSQTTQGSK